MSELDATYKLLTALDLAVEEPCVEPLINQLPRPAYSRGVAKVVIDKAGDAIVTIDGKSKLAAEVSFSDVTTTSILSLHPGEKFSATVSEKGKQQQHADLQFRGSLMDSDAINFKVSTDGQDGRVIDVACSTQQGIAICNETIEGANGKLLLKAHASSDIEKSPDSFHIDTRYIDPKTHTEIGKIYQGVEIQDGKLTAYTTVMSPSAE